MPSTRIGRVYRRAERSPSTLLARTRCGCYTLWLFFRGCGTELPGTELSASSPTTTVQPERIRYMPSVRVRENEPFEVALRRFKRTIEKTGLLTELRAREFYEKPTAERKRKLAAAVKRHYKRLRSQQLPPKLY